MQHSVRWAAVGLVIVAGVVALSAMLLLAAGNDADTVPAVTPPTGAARWQHVEVNRDAPFLPVLANTDLAAGANRLSFTVQDADGISRAGLRVAVKLYNLDADPDTPVGQQFARFIDYGAVTPVPAAHRHTEGSSLSDNARYVGAGVYVVPAFFSAPGDWGIEFLISESDDSPPVPVLFRLHVRERAAAPQVGEQAAPVATRTLLSEPDIHRLTSDLVPEPGLYQQSLDDALQGGLPIILIFSTPAYCHSRTCGPSLAVVKSIWREYVPRVTAIHVEVFENPQEPDALREAPAFIAWCLPSEPWIFLIGADGRIVARYEGTITAEELRADVRMLLGE